MSKTTVSHRALNKQSFDDAVEELCDIDERLGRIVTVAGPPPFWKRKPGFETLVKILLEQQISLSSARAAFRRLEERCGQVTPEQLLELGAKRIAATGQTRQKSGYLVELSQAVKSGTLEIDKLGRKTPNDAREQMVAVKGIGNWTADCYLLLALRKPDVWPVGDLALQNAAHKAYNMRKRPTPERMTKIGKRWQPYRAVAARLLWHYYLKGSPPLKQQR